ncbi:hypothetical protein BGZ50_002523 [Haplosporangium sp. Z 11]|nr:hypothetical protein BGZ50_002523 [Haplosporangium sp. Z 11]
MAALAAPTLAYEVVTCKKNATQDIVTSITSANEFCTMLTGYGVTPVAPNEGCASVYCYGPPSKLGPPMPKGYILSANYAKNTTYVQVTGCIDSSVWAQDPTDDGGQMDSHGWPYSCAGYSKFVSLIEPATNTFCLRCCATDDNGDCNTSISTKGCWNVIPGLYTMPDGSACKPPAGSPNATAIPTVISSTTIGATSTGAIPTGATPTGAAPTGTIGSGSESDPSAGKPNPTNLSNTGSRVWYSIEIMGTVAALSMAIAASF